MMAQQPLRYRVRLPVEPFLDLVGPEIHVVDECVDTIHSSLKAPMEKRNNAGGRNGDDKKNP